MIGDYIISKRKELNITREDFAKQLEISYSYLAMIESNKRRLSKKLYTKIANIFNVDENELKSYNSISYKNPKKEIIKEKIQNINIRIAKIDTEKIILEKERDSLCEILVNLEKEKEVD